MSAEIAPAPEALNRFLLSVENSARLAAIEIFSPRPENVAVFSSSGPSGAVGLAAARHLHNFGASVQVFFAGTKDHAREPALTHLDILERMRVPVQWVTFPEKIPEIAAGFSDGTALLAACAAEDGGARSERTESEVAALNYPGARFVRYGDNLETSQPPADLLLPVPPQVPLTRDEVRKLDQVAIERHHLPGIVLMENAGWSLAVHSFRAVKEGLLPEPILILCGRGNNGGDGFVAARHLAGWGVDVKVLLAGDMSPSTDDARANFNIFLGLGQKVMRGYEEDAVLLLKGALEETRSVLDALLGTGLKGAVRGMAADLLGVLSEAGRPALAADIPSGLDADTGEPLGPVAPALRTVTFAAPKVGFREAYDHTGEVLTADIGAPWYIAPWLASLRVDTEGGAG